MNAALWGAAGLAAAAAALAVAGPTSGDLAVRDASAGRSVRGGRRRAGVDPDEADQAAGVRWSRPVAALAGMAVWLLVGGGRGAFAGAMAALLLPVVIGRLEPARARRERLELIRAAPLVADLLAAALAAGVPTTHALPVVARSVGGRADRVLGVVHRRMLLGQPAEQAWDQVASTPGIGGIARAASRSARTGAPLAALLASAAVDLRAEASASALALVRGASVRAVLPLGLCLLPSFGLLGIVPVVAGLLPSL